MIATYRIRPLLARFHHWSKLLVYPTNWIFSKYFFFLSSSNFAKHILDDSLYKTSQQSEFPVESSTAHIPLKTKTPLEALLRTFETVTYKNWVDKMMNILNSFLWRSYCMKPKSRLETCGRTSFLWSLDHCHLFGLFTRCFRTFKSTG